MQKIRRPPRRSRRTDVRLVSIMYFIDTATKKVVSARTKEEARKLYGMSHVQMANEINLYDPSNDKHAIIPQELAAEIEEFKRQKLIHM